MKSALLVLLVSTSINAIAQTPQLVYDIMPGAGHGNPSHLTVFNNKLFFSAETNINGGELWSYDGTNNPAITHDINSGIGSSMGPIHRDPMAVMNGKLYFGANNGSAGFELMMYDGVNPPSVAADINPGSAPSQPHHLVTIESVTVGTRIFFAADNGTNGVELYIYDGTNAPVMIDLFAGAQSSIPQSFTELNGKVYFSARDSASGNELFVYDPATNLVSVAADIIPGINGSYPLLGSVYNGKLYFMAGSDTYGSELYSFDGTVATRLTDLAPGNLDGVYAEPFLYNNMLYFDGSTTGILTKFYKYDPSTGNTTLVYDINPTGGTETFTVKPAIYNNKLYFGAVDGIHGSELWVHDGTTTTMVADLYPGTSGMDIHLSELTVYNNRLYFRGRNGTSGHELFSLADAELSLQNVNLNGSVAVMPNPTTGDANLQLSLQSPQALSMQLTDATGKLVWQSPATNYAAGNNNSILPLSAEASGIYFYQVFDSKGVLMASGKLQKQ